jgi:hypothetical protein
MTSSLEPTALSVLMWLRHSGGVNGVSHETPTCNISGGTSPVSSRTRLRRRSMNRFMAFSFLVSVDGAEVVQRCCGTSEPGLQHDQPGKDGEKYGHRQN